MGIGGLRTAFNVIIPRTLFLFYLGVVKYCANGNCIEVVQDDCKISFIVSLILVLGERHKDWLFFYMVGIKDFFSKLVIDCDLNDVRHCINVAKVIADFGTGLNTVHNRHVEVKEDHVIVTFRRPLNFLQSLQAIDCLVYHCEIL